MLLIGEVNLTVFQLCDKTHKFFADRPETAWQLKYFRPLPRPAASSYTRLRLAIIDEVHEYNWHISGSVQHNIMVLTAKWIIYMLMNN